MKIFANKKSCINNEEGFTLIEIIAVIIILGIMAAVAVPKFFDMQEDAKEAVINGALAEGAARFNHAFSRYILDNSRAPTGIDVLQTADYLGATAATGEIVGDFVLSWTAGGTGEVDITVISCETIDDGALLAGSGLDFVKTISGIDWYIPPT